MIRNSTIACRTPLRPSTKPIRARNPNRSADRREGMSPRHLALIRQLSCCVTGRPGPNDPHHIKSGPAKAERGTSLKATDRWAVPLCREAHNAVEDVGSRNEEEWFRARGIEDVVALATDLWAATGNLELMRAVVWAHQNGVAYRLGAHGEQNV